MAADELLLSRDGAVAVVTLNRPERLNAITPTLSVALRETFTTLAADDTVRAVVLTGAGRGFCAGADMKLLQDLTQGATLSNAADAPVNPAARPELQQRYNFLAALPQPVIAAVNGPAAGIGFVLALFADLRFASADASFSTGFARRGLIAEHGSAWGLAHLVGPAHAADLLLSSRKVGADEAQRMGLVNRVLPPEQLLPQALAYAQELASACSPRSLRIIKQQLQALPFQGMAEHFEEADRLTAESLKADDFREGVAHFVEKRPPRFTGR